MPARMRSRPDLRRTPDGRLVLEHDLLAAYPPSLPLLADLVTMAHGRVRLDIELKEAGYEREVLEALSPLPPDLLISSFLPSALAAVRELDRSVETALIIERRTAGATCSLVPTGVGRTCSRRTCRCSTIAFERLPSSAGVRWWSGRSMTPPALSALLADPAVGWVITDVPDVALRLRSG